MLSDLLIKALLAAGLCIAAWGAWHQFTGHYEAIGAAQQQAKDAPVIAGLTKQRDQAIAANASLTGDVAQLRASAADANARLEALAKQTSVAQAAAAEAVARAKAQAKAAQAELARLATIVDRAPSTEAIGGVCARADDLLGRLVAGSVFQ